MDRQSQSHGNLRQSNRKEGNTLFEISVCYVHYAEFHEVLKLSKENMEFEYFKKVVLRYLVDPWFVDRQRVSTRWTTTPDTIPLLAPYDLESFRIILNPFANKIELSKIQVALNTKLHSFLQFLT